MLERADQGIGEILQAIDVAGIANNTLVIFTNDNGGEWLTRNAPLFHRKWTVWEGGIRVPAIMRWPGRIPAGQVTPQVGITMDFTATILALARRNRQPVMRPRVSICCPSSAAGRSRLSAPCSGATARPAPCAAAT